jgi:hypothetical protein
MKTEIEKIKEEQEKIVFRLNLIPESKEDQIALVNLESKESDVTDQMILSIVNQRVDKLLEDQGTDWTKERVEKKEGQSSFYIHLRLLKLASIPIDYPDNEVATDENKEIEDIILFHLFKIDGKFNDEDITNVPASFGLEVSYDKLKSICEKLGWERKIVWKESANSISAKMIFAGSKYANDYLFPLTVDQARIPFDQYSLYLRHVGIDSDFEIVDVDNGEGVLIKYIPKGKYSDCYIKIVRIKFLFYSVISSPSIKVTSRKDFNSITKAFNQWVANVQSKRQDQDSGEHKDSGVSTDQSRNDNKIKNSYLNSSVNLQIDASSVLDELGRRPFANALYEYIIGLWKNEVKQSYTIHINGEWGSGKSNFLFLLKERLERKENKLQSQWIVVEFNAWQNQHIQMPWWAFLDNTYRSISKDANWRKRFLIFLKEHYWRLVSMNVVKWVVVLIFLGILTISLVSSPVLMNINQLLDPSIQNNKLSVKDKLGILFSVVSFIGTVWLFFNNVINSLLPGSEEAAKNYKQHVRDPMQKIKDHYADIIRYSSKNVAVFIDDIDRCEPKFVVGLLEGLQTLFKTEKVLYVIAGDSSWIRESFEIQYEGFKEKMAKEGKNLGYLFLEKTIQQSITLPSITNEVKRAYWKTLLTGNQLKNDESKFDLSIKKIELAKSEAEMTEIIKEAPEEEKTVLRSKAAEKISTQEIIKEIEHDLLQYHELLEPNPRAMKRLVNNIALEKASNFIGGINDKITLLSD